VLINTSLSNSMIYQMSIFLVPKTNIKRMDKLRRKFFWQRGSLKKSTTWSGGPKYVGARRREVWELKI
jgi:hypothetical protein